MDVKFRANEQLGKLRIELFQLVVDVEDSLNLPLLSVFCFCARCFFSAPLARSHKPSIFRWRWRIRFWAGTAFVRTLATPSKRNPSLRGSQSFFHESWQKGPLAFGGQCECAFGGNLIYKNVTNVPHKGSFLGFLPSCGLLVIIHPDKCTGATLSNTGATTPLMAQ